MSAAVMLSRKPSHSKMEPIYSVVDRELVSKKAFGHSRILESDIDSKLQIAIMKIDEFLTKFIV